jgi:hypothetical protein
MSRSWQMTNNARKRAAAREGLIAWGSPRSHTNRHDWFEGWSDDTLRHRSSAAGRPSENPNQTLLNQSAARTQTPCLPCQSNTPTSWWIDCPAKCAQSTRLCPPWGSVHMVEWCRPRRRSGCRSGRPAVDRPRHKKRWRQRSERLLGKMDSTKLGNHSTNLPAATPHTHTHTHTHTCTREHIHTHTHARMLTQRHCSCCRYRPDIPAQSSSCLAIQD